MKPLYWRLTPSQDSSWAASSPHLRDHPSENSTIQLNPKITDVPAQQTKRWRCQYPASCTFEQELVTSNFFSVGQWCLPRQVVLSFFPISKWTWSSRLRPASRCQAGWQPACSGWWEVNIFRARHELHLGPNQLTPWLCSQWWRRCWKEVSIL